MEIRWIIDNALNFAPHAVVLVLAVGAYAVFGRHWPLAIASLVVVLLAGGYIARSDALLVRAQSCEADARITVATFNIQTTRSDLGSFARYAEAEGVDVIILQERTFFAGRRATELYERYPYRVASSPPWIEIVSKVPLDDVEAFPVSREGPDRWIWKATIADPLDIDLYFFHAVSARSPHDGDARSRQFELVKELLDGSEPVIVAGDLNASVLDPSLASMLRSTGLRSAVSGRRDSPTWPSGLGFLGIRIDHVLERGFEVCRVETGPSFGSDHRPVVVELARPVD